MRKLSILFVIFAVTLKYGKVEAGGHYGGFKDSDSLWQNSPADHHDGFNEDLDDYGIMGHLAFKRHVPAERITSDSG